MPFTLAVIDPEDPAPAAASGALPNPAATEPGTVWTSCEKTRPFRGRLLTSLSARTSPREELVVSTRVLAADTVTVSLAAPTFRVTSTTVALSTVTTLPLDTTDCRPGASTITWYLPGGRVSARYSPLEFETA